MMLGLRDYVRKNGFHGIVLGMSGGIDSALTAAVAVDALGAGARPRRAAAVAIHQRGEPGRCGRIGDAARDALETMPIEEPRRRRRGAARAAVRRARRATSPRRTCRRASAACC